MATKARVKVPKPIPAPPTHDALGIPVQPWAAEAFANAYRFDALIAKLREALTQLDALAGAAAAAHLDVPAVRAKLERAIADAERARPQWTDCPLRYDRMRPHAERCNVCLGLFWCGAVPRWLELPAGALDAMKAHYRASSSAGAI